MHTIISEVTFSLGTARAKPETRTIGEATSSPGAASLVSDALTVNFTPPPAIPGLESRVSRSCNICSSFPTEFNTHEPPLHMELNKSKLLLQILLLEEENDDDYWIKRTYYRKKRLQTNAIFKNRYTEDCFNSLIFKHLESDPNKFKEYFRLSSEQFHFVLSLIENDIVKLPTKFVEKPISPAKRLAVTLRYMATGESFRSLAFSFRISHCHISQIVREVLKCLCDKLVPIFLPTPTKDRMKTIASEFYDLWDFPNCCGAVDGKHCRIVYPDNSGSLFFNYKSFYSVVLLALVDAKYRFFIVDVASYGKEGDSGIYEKSHMKTLIPHLMRNDSPLSGTNIILPNVIVGDEAFHLSSHLMRSYHKSQCKYVFNKRLCRPRRTVENAFGILSQTFRVFFQPIAIKPQTTDLMITACCCLHNMLRTSNDNKCELIQLQTFYHLLEWEEIVRQKLSIFESNSEEDESCCDSPLVLRAGCPLTPRPSRCRNVSSPHGPARREMVSLEDTFLQNTGLAIYFSPRIRSQMSTHTPASSNLLTAPWGPRPRDQAKRDMSSTKGHNVVAGICDVRSVITLQATPRRGEMARIPRVYIRRGPGPVETLRSSVRELLPCFLCHEQHFLYLRV
ncbi:uncharacterized protein [Periplaneta americana]|uniref:uncharacterized protein n=1 Tax=Periplaneta americana TaxID=6978 RepID=UPI0037E812B4